MYTDHHVTLLVACSGIYMGSTVIQNSFNGLVGCIIDLSLVIINGIQGYHPCGVDFP